MSTESFPSHSDSDVDAHPPVGAETSSLATDDIEGRFVVPEAIEHLYEFFEGHLDGSYDLYSSIISVEKRKKNVRDWVGHHVDRSRISFEEGLAVLVELGVFKDKEI